MPLCVGVVINAAVDGIVVLIAVVLIVLVVIAENRLSPDPYHKYTCMYVLNIPLSALKPNSSFPVLPALTQCSVDYICGIVV